MVPLGVSMNTLALDLRVPVARIAEIVHQRRGATPDTALRIGRYFNTSVRFLLNTKQPGTSRLHKTSLGHRRAWSGAPSGRCAKTENRSKGLTPATLPPR